MPTILLIEDEEKSIDLLSLHLSGAGFAVEVARDGRAGLESVRKLRPAGIVLDIVLPELDGWDVLAALKADPEVADIPVIVVSMLDERGKGFALGASEYLVKPVGRREVQNALERCVHGGGVASRTVLVIDDDPRAVALLEATFADQGYAVLTATRRRAGTGAGSPRAAGRRTARSADARDRWVRGRRAPARGPRDRRDPDRHSDLEDDDPRRQAAG